MSFAYFLVFPMVFRFMARIAPEGVAWMTDIDKYFSFVLTTFVAFGVTFEVPVLVIVLVRVGVISLEKLKEIRPYVVVGAFVIGAIFTPPDVISQFMLAVPPWFLYELGLVLARFVRRPSAATEAAAGDELDKNLKQTRPYVVVGSCMIGALFTPPDVISQFMLAVPLWFLYELGLVLARFVGRPSAATEAASGDELDKNLNQTGAGQE